MTDAQTACALFSAGPVLFAIVRALLEGRRIYIIAKGSV